MRKTSHDGVDTTSITSGIENEMKKSGTAGLMKIKKSSIKRKVPNFSHESDDGIVEPLLQSDKEKTETAPRSAKYLLSKTKTDSISENEDSIKMSEISISSFSVTTPTTAVNKVITTTNSNNVNDCNNVTNAAEATSMRNHMNTNIFCGPEISKTIISTKSPILVELDASKTTGYNPSLIFTTAKIHSDCKTKLMEPVQVTPVPIISTIEKVVGTSGNLTDIGKDVKDVSKKSIELTNNSSIVFDKLNKTNTILSKDDKPNLESDIRNNSTSKTILNVTENNTSGKCDKNMPISKKEMENNDVKKTEGNSSFTAVSARENALQTKQTQILTPTIKHRDDSIKKSESIDKSLPLSSVKSAEQTSDENNEKKITVQGSKKLQRQKKATIDDSQDTTSATNIMKDKPLSDEKKKPIVSQPKTTLVTSTTTSTITVTTKSPAAQSSNTKSNNIAKNFTPQPIVSSKVPNQTTLIQKASESKIQTPISKIPTPTTPVSTCNIVTKSQPQNNTFKPSQGTSAIKSATSSVKEENFDSINKNELVTRSGIKEKSPVSTEKKSPVPKTLPPYIVSTSKTKIGTPVVTSSTLKSEGIKSVSDSKSSTSSTYLVKTTPSTSLKSSSTTGTVTSSSSSQGTKQSSSLKQTKSNIEKQKEDRKA